ncbi:MAG TPA: hypothetical protein ENI73_03165 [Spirochaetes bacterium]|nr:hypothetical protein [Spirochaetota bacterium]
MLLNDLQKIDFYQGLKQISLLMTSYDTDQLDLKGVDNRIQQAVGVINLLETLDIGDQGFKKVMINTLKSLYQRKKELLYGFDEHLESIEALVACG